MPKKAKKWIQKALESRKEGALHRQLGVSPADKIPFTTLEKIRAAKIGSTVTNPCETGNRRIKVTRLLKKRAVCALNIKRIGQKA